MTGSSSLSNTGDRQSSSRFRWTDADAYLFDIDGTLLNSGDAVHYNAFHAALRAVFDVSTPIDEVPVHGNTDIGILRAVVLRNGFSDAEFERRLPEAMQHMCASVKRTGADMRPQICPSVLELLQELRSRGKLMGVVSGNLEPIGWAKLRAAELREYFNFGCFSSGTFNFGEDDSNCTAEIGATPAELRVEIFRNGVAEVHRRLGEAARVCILGDTPSDISAARELSIPVIAVATGIYGRDELSRCSPQLCIGCFSDLLDGMKK